MTSTLTPGRPARNACGRLPADCDVDDTAVVKSAVSRDRLIYHHDTGEGITMTSTPTHPHPHPATPPAHDERRQIGQPRIPLWAALASGVAISVALGFALRALGRALVDVPAALTPLQPAALLAATILPVLGCGFGFYMSFHAKPGPYSMRLFVGIGALMGLAGVAISATKLPASAGGASIITTITVALAPTLLIIPALLTLVPRSKAQR
jgi:hypothetical protein